MTEARTTTTEAEYASSGTYRVHDEPVPLITNTAPATTEAVTTRQRLTHAIAEAMRNGEWGMVAGEHARAIMAADPDLFATTEAEALAALLDSLGDAWEVSRSGDEYEVKVWTRVGEGPTVHVFADTLAAALAATDRPDWTEPQSLMPAEGGKA